MITPPSPLWSRSRALILLGGAACVACCALPLGAAILGAATVAVAASVLEPIAAVLLAAGIVVGGAALLGRRRASSSCGTSNACAVDQSCGCGPSLSARARAVGCTLADDEMPSRGDAFRALFQRGVKRREVGVDRAAWTFTWSSDLERDARALAAAEHGCCSFWEFHIKKEGDELRWEARVPPDRTAAILMLDEIARDAMNSSSPA